MEDPLKQLRDYAEKAREMDDVELAQAISGWRAGTERHIVLTDEYKRRHRWRDQRVAWIALAVSALSLIVASIALMHGK